MTSSKPYLIRAIFEWLVDNKLTPYVMVDAMAPHVSVPERFVEDGQIVLNIAPQAVARLSMDNVCVEFDASFSGIAEHIYVPVQAVKAIYAFENGRGMVFSDEDELGDEDGTPPDDQPQPPTGRPNLKIVK